MKQQDSAPTGARLSFLRITFIAFLGSVAAFAVALAALKAEHRQQILPSSDIVVVAAVLGAMGAACIAAGYYISFRARKKTEICLSTNQANFFLAQVVRAALLESVAVYGFVIGLLGAGWTLVIPFLAAAAATLVHSFPKSETPAA